MNILIFNTLYAPINIGGAELSVQSLAEGLAKRGHNVGVVTLGECNEISKLNDVQIWRFKLNNSFWPFVESQRGNLDKLKWHTIDIYNSSYKYQLEEVFSSFKPDIIHTNNLAGFSIYIWIFAKKYNVKIVHTLRDYYLQCPKTTRFKNNKVCIRRCVDCKVFSMLKKVASNNVDVVVGISKHILEGHINTGYFHKAEGIVVYNGFDSPVEINRDEYKTFFKRDFIKLGYIGRIDDSKGIDLLIDTLKELNNHKNWELTIAGKITISKENEYKEKLKGRVKLLGFMEPKAFFDEIDVLMVPSIWEEPFGRVVIEGLINNKIVLGSSRGGIPELLNSNEKFLFEPTKESLTDFLQDIFNNPTYLNEFDINANFLHKFRLDNIIDKYIEIFQS